ncbi:MAG: TrmH family RNA methyltransferase [Bacteroidota bacterium]|nr:TrmH family RNA methyltransferase [Bacteroidota bacterium]
MKQLSTSQLNRPDADQYKASEKIPVIIVLDNIRSGLNVGAIFRTTDAFSMEAIYLCGITVQPPHAEIMKTALGATDSVTWKYFESTKSAVEDLIEKDYQVMPVEQTDQAIHLDEVSFPEQMPMALIFGNEMRGIDASILSMCQQSIEIPQDGIKHSLNVATTAGIVMWECFRQFRRRRLSSAL